MSSYLVTGATRGLGLGLVEQLAQAPPSQVSIIFATSRGQQPSTDLQKLVDASSGRIVYIPLDITDRTSIDKAVGQVESKLQAASHHDNDDDDDNNNNNNNNNNSSSGGLDVLINNAGTTSVSPGGIAKMDNLRYLLQINVEGVADTMGAFIPLLEKGQAKKIVNISSTLGSITLASQLKWPPTPAYKISKAALNMLTVQYAQEYAEQGFTIFAISPGWLKTDLGGQDADLEVHVGAKAVVDAIFKSNAKEYNGTYRDIHVPGYDSDGRPGKYVGKIVPW